MTHTKHKKKKVKPIVAWTVIDKISNTMISDGAQQIGIFFIKGQATRWGSDMLGGRNYGVIKVKITPIE